MRYFFKPVLFAIFFLVLFFACKKYPENKLWFKNPEKAFKGGIITLYTINGLDQMPAIRSLYGNFPYNYFGSPIQDVFALPFSFEASSGNFTCDYGEGSLKFSAKKKDVEIQFKPKNADAGAQNIFLAPLTWKILKLTKGGQMKIQATYNFKTYLVQFN